MPVRVAICSDEVYPVHAYVIDPVKSQGHGASLFGTLATGTGLRAVTALKALDRRYRKYPLSP